LARIRAVPSSEIGQRRDDRLEVIVNEREPLTNLQNGGGIDDVLARGAPVDVLSQITWTLLDDLLDHRRYRIPKSFRLAFQPGQIEIAYRAMPFDLGDGGQRDDP
jgi:hypothetical protein